MSGRASRVAVVAVDTRGGLQPYVALARGLARAGHEVRLVAPADAASMAADAEVPLATLSGSVESALRGAAGAAERGALASARVAARELAVRIDAWTREALEACEGVDVVTGGVGGMVVALSVAEKIGVPFVEAHLQPIGAPTHAYPAVLFPGTPRWLGAPGRLLAHHLSELGIWMPFRGAMASARASVLGLRGRARAHLGQPVLYGISRHVVAIPEHGDRPRHATGYWTLPIPESWRPPAALEAFVARGGPVVSIGFGSMASEDPDATTELVLGAVRRAGVRAILLAGWGGLATRAAGDDVLVADAIPHEWLFPRVAAAVHHGGAGTTGAALRAGVPAVVVPFTMDQPFWGSRVAALGVGPPPIPRGRLTQERLAAALARALDDAAMRARAAELGARIRAEDGVAEAVAHLSRVAR